MMDSDTELFPIVDDGGNVIGKATRKECHSGSMLLHPVVHLHVFNSQGDLLLQKRALSKDIQPGKWDTSVGGHVNYGEEVFDALLRESREELGISGFSPVFCYKYIFQSPVEREFVSTFRTVFDGPFHFDPVELDGIRFWSLDAVSGNLGHGVFTPNFEMEFARLSSFLNLKL